MTRHSAHHVPPIYDDITIEPWETEAALRTLAAHDALDLAEALGLTE